MAKVVNMRPWIAANPLKQYREKHRIAANHCAALIGISRTALVNWEEGVSVPTEKNFITMERLIPGITRRWGEWLAARPTA